MRQQVRDLARKLHRSIRTEQAYLYWIEKFLRYRRNKLGAWQHPAEMGSPEINDFLTYLAVERHVSASTQIQAFSALLCSLLHNDLVIEYPGAVNLFGPEPDDLP